jgi:hypothetical protein
MDNDITIREFLKLHPVRSGILEKVLLSPTFYSKFVGMDSRKRSIVIQIAAATSYWFDFEEKPILISSVNGFLGNLLGQDVSSLVIETLKRLHYCHPFRIVFPWHLHLVVQAALKRQYIGSLYDVVYDLLADDTQTVSFDRFQDDEDNEDQDFEMEEEEEETSDTE